MHTEQCDSKGAEFVISQFYMSIETKIFSVRFQCPGQLMTHHFVDQSYTVFDVSNFYATFLLLI